MGRAFNQPSLPRGPTPVDPSPAETRANLALFSILALPSNFAFCHFEEAFHATHHVKRAVASVCRRDWIRSWNWRLQRRVGSRSSFPFGNRGAFPCGKRKNL